jgi:hypothetical protein
VRQSSTDAFGDMRSWRPEHFTVRSGSKPVMEYPRSGIPFSPEASGSPSPQAKNPLGKREEEYPFPGEGPRNHKHHCDYDCRHSKSTSRQGLGDSIVGELQAPVSCRLTVPRDPIFFDLLLCGEIMDGRWPISRRKNLRVATGERRFPSVFTKGGAREN